ncbi:MAG: ankyrin repeat domain-containing protein [Planctomycetaceae bacterium]|jgi:ankyrin repeat protein|nr:ankyrin repeat domain-containing protein [Planctomycetaceae bacterium]
MQKTIFKTLLTISFVSVLFLTGCESKNLYDAAESGNLKIVKELVENGADVNTERRNPLMGAVKNGNLEVVKYLIAKGANVNQICNNIYEHDDETPLLEAARSGNLAVVKYLVEKDADVNIKNEKGKTPLDVAKSEATKKALRDAGGKSGDNPLESESDESKNESYGL